jgi:hypothetical protein
MPEFGQDIYRVYPYISAFFHSVVVTTRSEGNETDVAVINAGEKHGAVVF